MFVVTSGRFRAFLSRKIPIIRHSCFLVVAVAYSPQRVKGVGVEVGVGSVGLSVWTHNSVLPAHSPSGWGLQGARAVRCPRY